MMISLYMLTICYSLTLTLYILIDFSFVYCMTHRCCKDMTILQLSNFISGKKWFEWFWIEKNVFYPIWKPKAHWVVRGGFIFVTIPTATASLLWSQPEDLVPPSRSGICTRDVRVNTLPRGRLFYMLQRWKIISSFKYWLEFSKIATDRLRVIIHATQMYRIILIIHFIYFVKDK